MMREIFLILQKKQGFSHSQPLLVRQTSSFTYAEAFLYGLHMEVQVSVCLYIALYFRYVNFWTSRIFPPSSWASHLILPYKTVYFLMHARYIATPALQLYRAIILPWVLYIARKAAQTPRISHFFIHCTHDKSKSNKSKWIKVLQEGQ